MGLSSQSQPVHCPGTPPLFRPLSRAAALLVLSLLSSSAPLLASAQEYNATAWLAPTAPALDCGFDATESRQGHAAQASPRLFHGAWSCGACYAVDCNPARSSLCRPGAPPVMVTIASACGGQLQPGAAGQGSGGPYCAETGSAAGISLSAAALSQLLRRPTALRAHPAQQPVLPVRLRRASCRRTGGITFACDSRSTQWFLAVRIQNVAGPGALTSVSARLDNQGPWVALSRLRGSVWGTSFRRGTWGLRPLTSRSVSFRLVTLEQGGVRREITAGNVLPRHRPVLCGKYSARINFSKFGSGVGNWGGVW